MDINPSSLYYKSKGEKKENITIMNEIDRISLDHPTTGVRSMTLWLRNMGYIVNHKRVSRLMHNMGIEAIYPRKCLSKNDKPTFKVPYLLRNMEINSKNQVWSTDISYIPMENGFMYLYAIIDVYSRYIMGWRLSNTLHASNCVELLHECVTKNGIPQIVNTDQGSQYTGIEWKRALDSYGIQMSMDGKGRCKDNIWIERFWRTIKQEYVYLNPTDNTKELRRGIENYIKVYNEKRPHQSLGGMTPLAYYKVVA